MDENGKRQLFDMSGKIVYAVQELLNDVPDGCRALVAATVATTLQASIDATASQTELMELDHIQAELGQRIKANIQGRHGSF